MNSQKTPLIQKLILAVLVLIFICLALILARTYRKSEPSITAAIEPQETEPTPTEEVRPIPSTNARVAYTPVPLKRTPADLGPSRPAAAPNVFPTHEAAFPAQPSAIPAAYTALVAPLPVSGQPNSGVAEPAPAGARVFGRVVLSGTPRPETPIRMDTTCGRLWTQPPTTRHYVVGQDQGLGNVLVYVKAGIGPINPNPNEPEPVLQNIRCFFEPYVVGVQTGQKLKLMNSDSVVHNVHATPKTNREFNVSMPSRGHVNEVSFGKPELSIRVKCDVHPWEFAYIHVLEHPFFAVTDGNGVFALPEGLPAGRYIVAALHLKAGETVQEVEVRDGENKTVEFVLNATR